tara:strand:- start:168 stop:434 length:267 start_codon:yes stop_codon:yes gene_type:complete
MTNLLNSIVEETNNIKEKTTLYSKRFLRKRAIKKVYEKIAYQQKTPADFTKEELRNFILKEEKKILQDLGWKSALITIGAMFGISTNL